MGGELAVWHGAARLRARAWWARQRGRDIGIRAVPIGSDWVYPDTVGGWVDSQRWRVGLRDGAVQRWIARAVPAGGVAVDVGACLGWYTLAFARQVGPTGRVLALEPDAGNLDLLTRAVGAGRLPQVDVRQLAAAEHGGWIGLYVATGDRGDHRTLPAEEPRRLVTVRGVALDQLLADEARVDVVKLAVQGAEVSVLRGLQRTLARPTPPRLLCAVVPTLLTRAGAGRAALFEPLEALGFLPCRLAADGTPVPTHGDVLWREAEAKGRMVVLFERAGGG